MKKIILSALLMCGSFLAANAQNFFAPVAGVNFANANVVNSSNTPETQMHPSFHVGVYGGFAISEKFYFIPGILFSGKGVNEKYTFFFSGERATRLSYVEVPVNVAFMSGSFGSTRFILKGGPYVAYALSGKQRIKMEGQEELKEDIKFGNNKGNYKPLEIGSNLNIGLSLPSGIFATANYSYGFTNSISGGSLTTDFYSNNVFGISIGYIFGGKNTGDGYGGNFGSRNRDFWKKIRTREN